MLLQITTLPTGMSAWTVIIVALIVGLPATLTSILSYRSQKTIRKKADKTTVESKADKAVVECLVTEIEELKKVTRLCEENNTKLLEYLRTKGFNPPHH